MKQLAREGDDRRGHGGREEQRLPLDGQVLEHALDVGEEAHVEHPVRLVEHEHLQAAELGIRLLEVIEQPPRGRDDDVDAIPECVLLRTHADAAEHRSARQRRVHRKLLQVLLDLRGQLAGGGQHEGARGAARLSHQPVQDWQQERGGLAASRHRTGEEVPALERRRDGLLLNGRRAREAQFLGATEQIGVQLESSERHCFGTSER